MIVHHRLEVGCEVDFCRFSAREVAKGRIGERGSTVLHRTGHAVAVARDLGQPLQCIEIELDVGNRTVCKHHATVRRARLHGDLGQPRHSGRLRGQRRVEAFHERVELFGGAVFGPDFPDFAADGDGHTSRLLAADVPRQVHAHFVVETLLLGERWLGEIDERGGVDIDVVETGRDRFAHERLDRIHFGDGIDGKLFMVDLKVVTLNEDGPGKAFT